MALSVVYMGGGGGGKAYPVMLEITMPPAKTEYKPGETLDLTGMIVKAVYNDGAKQIVTSQCTMEPADGTVMDRTVTGIKISWVWQEIQHTYTAWQNIMVMAASGITIKAAPAKTAYKAGEAFSTTGMAVVADYPSGEVDVTAEVTVTPADGTKIYESTTQFTVTWTDKHTGDSFTESMPITVTRVLSSVTVSAPAKSAYRSGENLDLAGAVVTAHYNSGATADVTAQAAFSPANGTALTYTGTVTVTASYTESGVTKTATTSVTVEPAVEIVTWADGTEEQLAAMLDAHYAGSINIYDYWQVGDERKVNLSAMAKGAVGETHVAQTVTMVLMDAMGKELTKKINGFTCKCAFVVGQKNCLANGTRAENGYMHPTVTSPSDWDTCNRREWCNDTYRNAFPDGLKALFKEFRNLYVSMGIKMYTADYFALPSEKEVTGEVTCSWYDESNNKQFEYYKISNNRIKYIGDANNARQCRWWGRSPHGENASTDLSYEKRFFLIDNGQTVINNYANANTANGIAPFGCI